MGLLEKLRGLVPVSSRSVHAMWHDIARRIDAQELATYRYIDYKVDDMMMPRLKHVEGVLDAHVTEASGLLWSMYRNPDESLDDARKRFFRELPQASGSLRLLQRASAQLLGEFDAFCKEHGIEYFTACGTLLGAIRHGGFIPWDDDLDVGIGYSELVRLMDVVNEQDRYVVTVVYDVHSCCKQLRFKWAQDDAPCFVDLFIYDYAAEATEEMLNQYARIRASIVEQVKAICQEESWPGIFVDSNDAGAHKLCRVFEDARKDAEDVGLICSKEQAQSFMWGVENIAAPSYTVPLAPLDWFMPYTECEFEGLQLPSPNNVKQYLNNEYGDWMSMPKDRSGDIVHTRNDEFSKSAIHALHSHLQ